jgi:hypothetical protein
MQKSGSSFAKASRDIGLNVVSSGIGRRRSTKTTFLQSIYRQARHWLAGRRSDIQIIAVQRGEYSIIT